MNIEKNRTVFIENRLEVYEFDWQTWIKKDEQARREWMEKLAS